MNWIKIVSKLIATLLFLLQWKKSVVLKNYALFCKQSPQQNSPIQFYWKLLNHISFEFFSWIFNKGTNVHLSSNTNALIKQLQNGGLLVTAHFGNWEFLAITLLKYNVPILASYQPLKSKFFNKLLLKFRSYPSNYVIDLTSHFFLIRDILNQKKLFALQLDQDVRYPKKFVTHNFLNQPIACSLLPDKLCKWNPSLPVYFGYTYRLNNQLHLEIIQMDKFDFNEYHKILSTIISMYPEQWVGFTHKRFKSLNPNFY